MTAVSPFIPFDIYCSVWQNLAAKYAPLAQRIERWPPKPEAQVRVLEGVFYFILILTLARVVLVSQSVL